MSKRLVGRCLGHCRDRLTGGAAAGTPGTAQTYLVVYKQQAVPADAAASISSAGGSLLF